MDTKKLIGTIIGVTMFAVLIAGATFAWLTFGTEIVTTNVNTANSMNFLVDYTKGTAITDVPMVDSTLVTPSQTASLVVKMVKHNNSVDGHGSISLTTTSTGTLTTNGIVRWAICRDAVDATNTVDDVCGSVTSTSDFSTKALNTGKITETSTIVLLNDAMLSGTTKCAINVTTPSSCATLSTSGGSGTKEVPIAVVPGSTGTNVSTLIPTGGVQYFVYFWLDGETISNAEKNQTYTGYIHASATQLQT